jgi:hypothetical protein
MLDQAIFGPSGAQVAHRSAFISALHLKCCAWCLFVVLTVTAYFRPSWRSVRLNLPAVNLWQKTCQRVVRKSEFILTSTTSSTSVLLPSDEVLQSLLRIVAVHKHKVLLKLSIFFSEKI